VRHGLNAIAPGRQSEFNLRSAGHGAGRSVEGDYLVVSLRDKRLDAVIAVSFSEAMLERIEE